MEAKETKGNFSAQDRCASFISFCVRQTLQTWFGLMILRDSAQSIRSFIFSGSAGPFTKLLGECKEFLKENGICFKCCASMQHLAKDCKYATTCLECKSERHISALNPDPALWIKGSPFSAEHDGSKTPRRLQNSQQAAPKSVDSPEVQEEKLQDSNSNCGLEKSVSPYQFSWNGMIFLTIVWRFRHMSDTSAAANHPHLQPMAHLIPELDPSASIMLLLGQDVISVHKLRKKVNGPRYAPFAQKLDLGWPGIFGNVCVGGVHKPTTVNTFYTSTTERKRPFIFEPCPNIFHVKEK